MKTINKVFTLLLVFLLLSLPMMAQEKLSLKSSTIEAFRARHIGPATMSGRISAIDAIDSRPIILYVGAASGGLWKSSNGGVKFKPVFDKYTQSIGAIRIDQKHPDTVWVGTGEPWTRNSVSVGDGIYKTTDGGDSWKKMGLENTERIGRIRIHPENSDTVFVAALGHLWNANEERGLFKTSDGGKTWKKILYIDENTGCTDIAIDPVNPDIMFATMWDFRRKAWTFRSGGTGSGLYRSTDGGKTWERLSDGLPEGELGRIAVSISPVNPKLVYALIESEKSALYRSEDSGESWTEVNKTIPIQERPFYFSYIMADPIDTNRVYKPSFNIHVSNNKGENFRATYVAGGNIHPDMHALWISKRNNNIMYVGTDGGVYVTRDKGSTWALLRNLPVSQFYHVAVDMEKPYNVYGGLQDNGSWYGPSEKAGGIGNADWKSVGFGDGFSMIPDRYNNDIIYWQFQGGEFFRYYKSSNEIKLIKPFPDENADDLRFNWDAAISLSKTRKVIYVGSQYLFQSFDMGDSWKRISGDLTTNDKEKQKQYETGGLTLDNSTAENHCTIVSIAESPEDEKVIWVGTDDGNLQITKDEGKSWTNTVSNIPDLPANTWCSYIYASTFDAGTAYVTFDGHKIGDKTPYLFKTTDYGQTWTALASESIESYCHSVVQDFVNPNLLFLGTEFGLYVSFDDGLSWNRMKGNLPKVSVREIVIHPRDNDLVLGTHGRGVIIIDDISPLRQISKELLDKDVAFLDAPPFYLGQFAIPMSFGGDDEFTGQNPPDAAIISYYLKKRHVFGNMHIEIYDSEGNFMVKLPAGKRKGLNRVSWTLMKKPPKVPSSPSIAGFAMFGPFYDPGNYTIKLIKGEDTYESKITLALDPDSPYSQEDRKLKIKTVNQGYKMLEDLAYTDAKATGVMNKARENAPSLTGSANKNLLALADQLEEFHKEMVETKMGGITGEEKLRGKIVFLYATCILYQGRPTNSQIDGLNLLEKKVLNWEEKIDSLLEDKLPKINKSLEKKGLEPIQVISLEEFKNTD
ncbi:MAG: glycosyl hydrolase [Bacteroidota bacterium]|nr:glycosyl hydrolase [Bacteroidota bacterium]